MERSATVTRRMLAASMLAALLCGLTLLASPPSASASNLKTRVWDFFEDRTLCTDGEGDLSQRSSSEKTALCASDGGGRNLFYNRFRYYDPAVGRYVTPDPIGLLGGANVYVFATNVTGWIDPHGLADDPCDGNKGKKEDGKQGLLVRFGKGPESAAELAADAARAERKGFPHGVSTKLVQKLKTSDKAHRSARREDVENVFPVLQTGGNPKHHTVVLPKPVTPEVAEQFNRLFQPK